MFFSLINKKLIRISENVGWDNQWGVIWYKSHSLLSKWSFKFEMHVNLSMTPRECYVTENIRLSADRLSMTLIIGGDFQNPTIQKRASVSSLILCACSNIHLSDYWRDHVQRPFIGYPEYFLIVYCSWSQLNTSYTPSENGC